ncbi:MAG: hypothetical protein COA43_13050, partial [Robiginitomaculum sp.]
LDGDGDLDVVTANHFADDVTVLLNNGDGTFGAHVSYGVGDGPVGLSLGDLNGDGKVDIAVANSFSDSVSVLMNLGAGVLAPAQDFPCGDSCQDVAIGDLDNDGDLDLAVRARQSSSHVKSLILTHTLNNWVKE